LNKEKNIIGRAMPMFIEITRPLNHRIIVVIVYTTADYIADYLIKLTNRDDRIIRNQNQDLPGVTIGIKQEN